MNEIFAIRLKALRKEKKITQQKLADMMGLTKAAISCYEMELTTPNYDNLRKLSDILDTSIDYLIGASNDRHINDVTVEYDIYAELNSMVSILANKTKPVSTKGVQITNIQRDILIATLYNAINIIDILEEKR